jgi:DNA-binding HxlR family transcriptional regulator
MMQVSCYDGVMLGRTYGGQNCAAARALELVGERWSLLILRDAIFRGCRRFSEFQRSLNLAPNILAARIERFVENGLFERQTNPDRPGTPEYLITAKGLDLAPVIIALTKWGDAWATPNGPPVVFGHDGCEEEIELKVCCPNCNATVTPSEIVTRPGPGARAVSANMGTAGSG